MAFGQRQIFPNDLRPRVAIGVSLPFNQPAVFGQTFQTKDAIKYNLVNYLLTNPGERIANPSFGAGLRAFIMEQITAGTLQDIEETIQEGVSQNVPNVDLQEVEVTAEEDFNTIKVALTYSVVNTGLTDNVELTFS
jgi:hypothetical protein